MTTRRTFPFGTPASVIAEATAKDREDAKREAQAHRTAEQNRIVRILREQGVDEAVIDKVQSEEAEHG